MLIEGFHIVSASVISFLLGIITSLISFVTPIRQEVPQLIKKPDATPMIVEEIRTLTKDEQTTMSASFIREFEGMISSNAGERR